MEWQPGTTAPRDGSLFIANGFGLVSVARWNFKYSNFLFIVPRLTGQFYDYLILQDYYFGPERINTWMEIPKPLLNEMPGTTAPRDGGFFIANAIGLVGIAIWDFEDNRFLFSVAKKNDDHILDTYYILDAEKINNWMKLPKPYMCFKAST